MYEETNDGYKVWFQLTSNDTYFSDNWPSGVKTAEEEIAEGENYCGTVNTIHKFFSWIH